MTVQCKCGHYCPAVTMNTMVPGALPVLFWMCPRCDFLRK